MALKQHQDFVVFEPKVYVLGVQRINHEGLQAFLSDEGFPHWGTTASEPSEIISEVAGRVCYLSFDAGRPHDEYIANIKRDRHGSVLEHAVITFILTGVSRSLTHELVRHRAGWSYSQLSQRFVNEVHAQVVCPKAVAATRGGDDECIFRSWRETVAGEKRAYREMVDELSRTVAIRSGAPSATKLATRLKKAVLGAARSVLGNAFETKIVCTVNARALRHFLEMRASGAADQEIRDTAVAMYRAALPYMPDILGDYAVMVDEDGQEYLTTDYPKV